MIRFHTTNDQGMRGELRGERRGPRRSVPRWKLTQSFQAWNFGWGAQIGTSGTPHCQPTSRFLRGVPAVIFSCKGELPASRSDNSSLARKSTCALLRDISCWSIYATSICGEKTMVEKHLLCKDPLNGHCCFRQAHFLKRGDWPAGAFLPQATRPKARAVE